MIQILKNCIPLLSVMLLTFLFSCSDAFLEENKKLQKVHQLDAPLFVEPVDVFTDASITISHLKNSDYKIIQYPRHVHFESLKGSINDTGNLTLRMKVDSFPGIENVGLSLLGTVVLDVSDYGLLAIQVVHMNMGDPTIMLTPVILSIHGETNMIDFGPSRGEEPFSIGSYYNGVLIYQIVDSPSWITFSPTNRFAEDDVVVLNPNETVDYAISVDRKGLTPGYYEGTITIMSNDVHTPVKKLTVSMLVRDPSTTKKIIPLEGRVADCIFDKEAGRLYLVTQNPSKVKIIDIASYEEAEIPLNNNATSISLSENSEDLLVGQEKLLSVYDLSNLSLKLEIPLEFNVASAIDGMNGFYYVSNKIVPVGGYGGNHLYQYNTRENTLSNITTNGVSGGNMIKLKESPYLLTTKNNNSPEGLYLIDISDEITAGLKYWHSDFGKKLWQFENGEYILGQRGAVFKTPDITTGEVEVVSSLKPYGVIDNHYEPTAFKWFEEVSATGSIWGIYYGSYPLKEYGHNYPQLLEWDLHTFQLKRNLSYSDYQTTIDGKTQHYPTLPLYLFSNNAGNELIVIKNIIREYMPEVDRWHIEVMDVSN